ncbi:peptide/nickel transport system substrate-binding protein [Sedimentibacter acidaminivorans]|uniref:Peptide/nickel transport system substrate-binding protein n=1 Tax=Sedimentibacter acidaminivorans TaxID=913099 RepID=A0ABS4GEZ1_9FIRM|nr:ABC transporter substrate-binding protein [Sedimentibacter acidaminivorans]MBP1926263.1 peptide/nickel transport system substrate-binding protein [Sedimentibacter acidaminivorans]
MKKFISLIIILLLSLSLAACDTAGQTEKTEQPMTSEQGLKKTAREERVLRMDGDNLGYPSVFTSSPKGRGYLLVSFTFDTLVWKDETGVIPLIAKDWSISDDNKTYTFNLNENIKFTDGTPLTAEDVKFSFDYLKEHPYQWVSVAPVEQVTAVDEKTVQIVLNEVYVPFVTDIAGNVPIMPKHIWENVTEPEKFNTKEAIVGSGPLILESYDKESGVYIYNANKDYFMGEVQIDKLIMSSVKNTKEALVADEIDMASNVKYGEAMKLKEENSKYKVIEGPGLWVGRLYFNFGIEELNIKEVRQAMYYAINRDELVQKALKGAAEVGNPGHIHPTSEWYSSDIKNYDYDTETAIELLTSVGITDTNENGIVEYNGKDLSYEFIVPEEQVPLAELITKYLGDIGIKLEVKAMDQNTIASLIKEGKFTLAFNGHGSFGGDPVLLKGFVSEETAASTPQVTTQGGQNWHNEEFNTIFNQQIVELDREKRYELVGKLQNIISDELPTLTLYYKKSISAYNPEVFDGWFFTKDGVSLAVPTIHNKLIFVRGQWNK